MHLFVYCFFHSTLLLWDSSLLLYVAMPCSIYFDMHYSIIWLYLNLFMHSTVDKHLSYFQFLAIKSSAAINIYFLKILFILDKGEGREKETETSVCGCLLHAPYWGPGPQPKHVLWLGMESATLWFAGRHSVHLATPARGHFNIYISWWTSHSFLLTI